MALECSSSFAINFSITIDASITLTSVAVTVDPDDEDISHWLAHFLYVAGIPAATAFRLNSADSLTGSFTPSAPEGQGAMVRGGTLAGTVQRPDGIEGDVDYEGTITIIQV